jgi:hypothetical protein
MSVNSMRVAAVAAVLGLSVAGYADDAAEANPDSRALLEYVKKLEARVNQLESEKQWPLDQVRTQSGSALENAVRSVNISGYMEFQYGWNIRHGGRGDAKAASPGFIPGTGGSGNGGEVEKKAFAVGAPRGDTLSYNQLAGTSNDDNGFSFQNLQLLVDKPLTTVNSTGFRISPQFGDVSIYGNRDGRFNAGDNAFDVREANFSWRTGCPMGQMEHVDLTVGKMATPLGLEVPENNQADNYGLVTRNNLHNFALPDTHTGLRVTMPWAACHKTMLYVVNGWDNVRDAGDGKTLVLSHEMGKLDFMNSTIILNGSFGNEGGGFYPSGTFTPGFINFAAFGGNAPDGNKVKLIEGIWKGEIDDKNQVAIDALWSTADKGAVDSFGDAEKADTHGASAYLRHQLSKTMYLAARGGWFASTIAGGSDLRVYDISVAMGWNLTDELTFAVEYRHDHSPTNDPFQGKSGGSFMSSQDRVTASMVFTF